MNKTELVDTVAKSTGLTKSDTKKTIDAVFEQITEKNSFFGNDPCYDGTFGLPVL